MQPNAPPAPESRHVKIQRIDSSDAGTISTIHVDGEFVCFGLELPWHGNRRNYSCIPAGNYSLVYRHSPKFGRRLHVLDVPDRSDILIHPGNRCCDTKGCILPGLEITRDRMPGAKWQGYNVLQSTQAINRLESKLPSGAEHSISLTPAIASGGIYA